MKQWRRGIAEWRIGGSLYLSIPFTWLLPEARIRAQQFRGRVFAGGPAVSLMPGFLNDIADVSTEPPVEPLVMHNPLATFTSRGCINRCGFCAVPRIEGRLSELRDFPVRPVICDNNFLACSRRHFDYVIDRLKVFDYVDFNQGLDARIFNRYHAGRFAELKGVHIRFAFDSVKDEAAVAEAVSVAAGAGLKHVSVYVLFGFRDTPDDALYRLEFVRRLGFRPNPMRYQPLDALEKNGYVAPGWSDELLRKVSKYYSRLVFYEHIPFAEFDYLAHKDKRQLELF